MQFGPYRVELSRTDKVLFPDNGITKGDLIDYYHRIAPVMLPHMKDRPVTEHRFPDGIDQEDFYQKNAPNYYPDWLQTIEMPKKDGTVDYVLCQNKASLVYLANQACITPHIWLSRIDKPHHPDRLIFDFDPPDEGSFAAVRKAAFALRELLEEVELMPYLMTSGSQGLHIYVPLNRDADFDCARSFARAVADNTASQFPDLLTTAQRKARRGDRIFIDTNRNAYAQTGVAPYAVRPIAGGPVATPLHWAELEDTNIHPQSYNMSNVFERLQKTEDPWQGMMRHARSLSARGDNLAALLAAEEPADEED